MASRVTRGHVLAFVIGLGLMAAVFTWNYQVNFPSGWDVRVYKAALHSLQRGSDPYADAIAIQRAFHVQHHPPGTPVPFSYVYSPMTLPWLRAVGALPHRLVAWVYWILFGTSIAVSFAVPAWVARAKERRWLLYLLAAAPAFPGLLQTNAIMSGNVAYILYGVMLTGLWLGWKRGLWLPFYAAVVLASIVKAPLLYLLCVPVLTERGQLWKAASAGAVGVALFAIQPHLWPSLFHHYMEAVELQFSYNQDFGASPAGALADGVKDFVSYKVVSIGFYLFTSLIFGTMLLWLRRRYFVGYFSRSEWIPVAVAGTMLLNPRVMEYDVAAITLFMALIVWRLFQRLGPERTAAIALGGWWLSFNFLSVWLWRPLEAMVLVGVFVAGAWDLSTRVRRKPVASAHHRSRALAA